MRLTFAQFKLLIGCTLLFTSFFALIQIACFSGRWAGSGDNCATSSNHRLPERDDGEDLGNDYMDLRPIYAITPTYARPVQKAELTRLSHTFLLVNKFTWIIVEDAYEKTDLVTNFVKHLRSLALQINSDLQIVHLNVPTPEQHKAKANDPNWLKPRGVLQRNTGLDWLRSNRKTVYKNGVVYFADDDNTYDLRLFEEMRSTQKVAVWPVGLVGGLRVEKPFVEKGKVVAWNTQWKPDRPYPMDMSGFSFSVDLLYRRPEARFTYKVPRGFQESHIISLLIDGPDELEPKADNCTKVYVWHTRTEKPNLRQELALKVASNHGMEL